jgi:hypothetical protein
LAQNLATKEVAVASRQCASHINCLTREFLTKSNMIVVHPTHLIGPPATFLFPQSKGRHFDTNEVNEAESHVVMNTLTEHHFQDKFKKWQKRWEWCKRWKGVTLRELVSSRPKTSF